MDLHHFVVCKYVGNFSRNGNVGSEDKCVCNFEGCFHLPSIRVGSTLYFNQLHMRVLFPFSCVMLYYQSCRIFVHLIDKKWYQHIVILVAFLLKVIISSYRDWKPLVFPFLWIVYILCLFLYGVCFFTVFKKELIWY